MYQNLGLIITRYSSTGISTLSGWRHVTSMLDLVMNRTLMCKGALWTWRPSDVIISEISGRGGGGVIGGGERGGGGIGGGGRGVTCTSSGYGKMVVHTKVL